MNRKFHDFNKKAATWDESTMRLKRSEVIAEHIKDKIKLEKNETSLLDFGCGTGQLSFLLSHYVRSVTAVDGSKEMICMLKNKITENNILNIEALQLDIDHEIHTLKSKKFDLITSSMVLHHLDSPASAIRELKLLLKDDGVICLVDLDKEDGSFHNNDPFITQHGFDRDEIKKLLESLGFFSVTFHTPFTIPKTGADGITREFPLFMAIASVNPPSKQERKERGEI